MWGRFRRAREFAQSVEHDHTSVPPRGRPSAARAVTLAALEPKSGKLWANADFAIAGAILVELVHEGRVDVAGSGKKLSLTLRDAAPLGDEVLDDALLAIGAGTFGQKLTRIMPFLATGQQMLDRLVAEGVLVRESSRTLGVLPTHRYRPTLAARDDVVERIRSTLVGESVPDEQTTLLIGALSLGIHPKLFVPRNRVRDARSQYEAVRERLSQDERTVLAGVQKALSDAVAREN